MDELTYDECDVLIEALDKWQSEDMSGELLGSIFKGMLGDKMSEEDKRELEAKEAERKEEREYKKRQRERKATILKAKLYAIQENAKRVV